MENGGDKMFLHREGKESRLHVKIEIMYPGCNPSD